MFDSLVLNLRIESGDVEHCPVLILDQLLHHGRQVYLLLLLVSITLPGGLTRGEPQQVQDGGGKMIHDVTNLIFTNHISHFLIEV